MQILKLSINGILKEFLVEEHAMISSVLRDQAGLTGTKIGSTEYQR